MVNRLESGLALWIETIVNTRTILLEPRLSPAKMVATDSKYCIPAGKPLENGQDELNKAAKSTGLIDAFLQHAFT